VGRAHAKGAAVFHLFPECVPARRRNRLVAVEETGELRLCGNCRLRRDAVLSRPEVQRTDRRWVLGLPEVVHGDPQGSSETAEGAGGGLNVAPLPADDRPLTDQEAPGEFGLAPAPSFAGRPDRLS
jgi:hypothetical protein